MTTSRSLDSSCHHSVITKPLNCDGKLHNLDNTADDGSSNKVYIVKGTCVYKAPLEKVKSCQSGFLLKGAGRGATSRERLHCYFLRGIDNGSGHLAVGLVSQSIFDDNNTILDGGKVVMFCCWPEPSSKGMSPVSVIFPGS